MTSYQNFTIAKKNSPVPHNSKTKNLSHFSQLKFSKYWGVKIKKGSLFGAFLLGNPKDCWTPGPVWERDKHFAAKLPTQHSSFLSRPEYLAHVFVGTWGGIQLSLPIVIIISMARYWVLPRHEFVSGPRAGCLTDGGWDQQELCLVLSSLQVWSWAPCRACGNCLQSGWAPRPPCLTLTSPGVLSRLPSTKEFSADKFPALC